MEKNQNQKEVGLKEHASWKQGPWRGYYYIGRYIMHRYGLVDDDFKILKNKMNVIYTRRSQIKRKKMLKELEGGKENGKN